MGIPSSPKIPACLTQPLPALCPCRLQPSQSLLAARGKLEVPPLMQQQMQKTYNESQASGFGNSCVTQSHPCIGGLFFLIAWCM